MGNPKLIRRTIDAIDQLRREDDKLYETYTAINIKGDTTI